MLQFNFQKYKFSIVTLLSSIYSSCGQIDQIVEVIMSWLADAKRSTCT